MDTLQQECGHRDLRLGFAPYITLLSESNKRLTDLADILGISRQACNQAVKQIEAAGYISRTADPADGRAKKLTLTSRGEKLSDDGQRITAQLDQQFADIVGTDQFADTSKSLSKIYRHLSLGLSLQKPVLSNTFMGALLPRLSDYVMRRLVELNIAKGHPRLKLSFAQVLTLIGPGGGRIQQMAATHDVSKQAISAIATELEDLGYLQRRTDPLDARQIVLQFTARGLQLIGDSVTSVGQLSEEFSAIIGKAAFKRMSNTLCALYRGLHLEQDVFEHTGAVDIRLLARQLQHQLGDSDSQALARLLLNSSRTTR